MLNKEYICIYVYIYIGVYMSILCVFDPSSYIYINIYIY